MKKGLTILLASLFVASGVVTANPALANTVNVVVDGKQVDFRAYGAYPEIVQGRTMIPIRAVVETMGATVQTAKDHFTITRTRCAGHVSIWWHTRKATVNQKPVQLDVPAYIKNGRTFVPLRFVSEAFNSKVVYDSGKRTVFIETSCPSESVVTTEKVIIENLDLAGEVVVIRNADSKDIDMTGWKLVSVEGNQVYHFPAGFVLKAGATVRIVSGKGAAGNPPGQLVWTTDYIWNNNGDSAVLYDNQGREVSRK